MLVVIGCGCKISSQIVLDQRHGTFTGLSKIQDSGSEASDSAKFGHGQLKSIYIYLLGETVLRGCFIMNTEV
jgi:hypothetical protein